jgi:FtsP/CotA-like multicopper oxidase with cupredoxin domain
MRWGFAVLVTAIAVQLAVVGGLVIGAFVSGGADAQTVREYNLEIVPQDIDYGGGNVWHAWTYKLAGEPAGTVPGPTITATVGEKVRVHVVNKLDLVHSFHSHFTEYELASDGSQANVISGVGAGAMIPPGGEWTYEFEATQPGIFYYHCHSADGDLMISQHIHQGLYGAIIVKDRDEGPVRDEVIFMAETGHVTEGEDVPFYIMNGLGLPGGEHALEGAYREGGFEAVASQLNVTVPAITAEPGEKMRVHVINIGDQIHSFHPHHTELTSLGVLDGRPWPANVLPLVPGAADTLLLEFTEPGLWLFHCHVVGHADAGMIGLFIIQEEDAEAPEPAASPTPQASAAAPTPTRAPPDGEASPTRPPPGATPTTQQPAGNTLQIDLRDYEISGRDGVDISEIDAGEVTIEARNRGGVPHELAIIKTDTDPDELPLDAGAVDEDAAGELIGRIDAFSGGQTREGTFTLEPGTYVLICNIPGHYQLGMRAALVVR